ncbi:MAG: 50S ribosomal protein L19 [Dehalococcoidia bacterium]|nr:50S ribosomal protein L19 [Dehalococcoidia bacterium]
MDIKSIKPAKVNTKLPKLSPGDNVKVSFKVKEANRERLQTFSGLIIKVNRGMAGGNFTVRKVTYGIGVEHTFPLASPLLEKIEVVRHGKVRRSKLYYIRRLSTKEARLKERRERLMESTTDAESLDLVPAPEAAEPVAEAK